MRNHLGDAGRGLGVRRPHDPEVVGGNPLNLGNCLVNAPAVLRQKGSAVFGSDQKYRCFGHALEPVIDPARLPLTALSR